MDFDHGATDSGPDPLADFSSCSHPFGPCPSVLEAVLRADRARYPDPSYRHLRERLGMFHGVDPDRILPGSGASELILRMVGAVAGAVLAWTPSFVEYRRAAHVCRRPFLQASEPDAWLASVPRGGIAFLCQPNNPDGVVHPRAFLEAAVAACRENGSRLVLDLAYADFCPNLPDLPEGCDLLFAPNKSFGLTGIRAGAAVCADQSFATALMDASPSWVIGSEGVSFLSATTTPAAGEWLRETLPQVRKAATHLRSLLEEFDWEVLPSAAHFFAARPPTGPNPVDPPTHSARWAAHLRGEGIKARNLSNTGFPGWLRLSARPGKEVDQLRSALAKLAREELPSGL